jgi:hypothetical protein
MKEKIDISKEELKNSYHIQKKIYEMEEKHLIEKHLLLATQRVLDIRDVRDLMTKTNNKELKDLIDKQYLKSVNDLMDIVFSMISEPPFCFIFENDIELDSYIVLEYEDMILVNGYLEELKRYNSNSINGDMLLVALNEAIFEYVNCLQNEQDYTKGFEDEFVQITEEQEDKDE